MQGNPVTVWGIEVTFCCARTETARGIDERHLSDYLTKLLIEQCCPLRKTIDRLINIRNKVQRHAIEGKISDADYVGYVLDIESGIMEIAKKINDIVVQLPEKIEQAINKAFSSTIPDLVEKSVQSAIHKVYEPSSKLTIGFNMLWNYMKKNGIRFDQETSFHLTLVLIKRKLSALKLLSSTVLTSDLIDCIDLLTKAFEVNNTGLIELIFKQQDSSKIDVPLALYNACAEGSVVIVHWFLKNFKQKNFDIKMALASCSIGRMYPSTGIGSFQTGRSGESGNVVLFLLKQFRTNIQTLKYAMNIALCQFSFNICKILLENTTNAFNAEAILKEIAISEEYYKSLDETEIILEELRYGNNDFLRFLLDKVDMKRAEKEIIERACICSDVSLMQMIFEKCSHLDIAHIMNIAIENKNLEAVKWICTNVENEQPDFESFIKVAINRGAISIIRYFTEIFHRKDFNLVDIFLAFNSGVLLSESQDFIFLFK
ncbi:unnamed protein product [Mytilus coruscus]|uniref:DZIP3-like HEPN domain-containing protein n=1 Tax=Mytilus coruscus TaxID=42192 RepID=A0A6J8EWR7_MYTCO|nr:unnamed protein product [Mytilus coruscus]